MDEYNDKVEIWQLASLHKKNDTDEIATADPRDKNTDMVKIDGIELPNLMAIDADEIKLTINPVHLKM